MLAIDVTPNSGVMSIRPEGRLGDESVRDLSDYLDARLRRVGGLNGLLLEAESFPSWRDWAGLLDHLRSIREQRERLGRVAVMTDTPAKQFMPPLSEYFPGAEVRHFGMDEGRQAMHWLETFAAAAVASAPAAAAPTAAIEELGGSDDAVGEGVITLDESELQSGDDEIDDWFR